MNIIFIGYDDDITDIKNENGDYGRYTDKPIKGLYMIDSEGDELYIEGIDKDKCNEICESILQTGYADLRSYGEYDWL